MSARSVYFAVLITTASLLIGLPNQAIADPVTPVSNDVVDAQSAPDQGSAIAIAIQYQHPVTVDGATTETAELTALPDGTLKLTETTVPVRVRQNGDWRPLDLTLRTQSDGTIAPSTSSVPVRLSPGGTGPLAQVQSASGEWLTETWPLGPLPTPTLSGTSATYPDVLPGVDLRLTATALGMSEVLVIKDAAAATDPRLSAISFGVNDGSMSTSQLPGGALLTTSADGSAQLVSAPPTWWDSSSTGAGAAGPGGSGVPLPLPHSDTANQITVDATAAATTADVTFPVYVDPSFTGVRTSYTFADSAYPTVSYWNGAGASDSYFHVGYINAANSDDGQAHTTRSYWSMAIDGMAGKHIVSAALDTIEEYAPSCTAEDVQLWTTTAPSASTTWNNQPTWSTLVDTASAAWGYSSACGPAPVGFDATAAVQAAADAGSTRMSLMLKAASESNWLGWKKFANNPTLEIVYQSPPSKPADRSVNGCYVQCTEPVLTHRNQPTITAQSSGDGGSFDYTFKVYAGHSDPPGGSLVTSVAVSGVALGTPATWAVTTSSPSHTLADGDYEYEVHACIHASTVCGDWSDWFTFTVDTQRPAAPTATSTDFALYSPLDPPPPGRTGNQGTPGSVTINSPAADNDYAYVYSPQTSLSEAAIPGCGTVGDVTTSCGITNNSLTISITPAEFTSSLSLLAIDRAGNISDTTNYTYYPNGTLANDPQHGWVTKASNLNSPTISDWSGAATPLTLTLRGTAAWASPSANGPYRGKTYDEALSLTGSTGAAADTGSSDVRADITRSLTVAVWAKENTTGAGGTYQTMVSQDGTSSTSGSSGFYLQIAAGHWRFCMQRAQPAGLDCTSIADWQTAVTPGTWTLVTGLWDAPARQLTLKVIVPSQLNFSTTLTRTSIAVAATGGIAVGRGQTNNSQTDWFAGQLADPLIYNAALGDAQSNALQSSLPTDLGGP